MNNGGLCSPGLGCSTEEQEEQQADYYLRFRDFFSSRVVFPCGRPNNCCSFLPKHLFSPLNSNGSVKQDPFLTILRQHLQGGGGGEHPPATAAAPASSEFPNAWALWDFLASAAPSCKLSTYANPLPTLFMESTGCFMIPVGVGYYGPPRLLCLL